MDFLRKNLLVIILVLVAVIIIIANVFLFINFQAKQKQNKISQDIQQVQQFIDLGNVAALDPVKLRSQGFDEQAVDLAEKTLQEKGPELEVLGIINSYNEKTSESRVQTLEKLSALGEIAIPALTKQIDSPISKNRYIAYRAVAILADKVSPEKRKELLDILKKGLTDSEPVLRLTNSLLLLSFGEKDGIPIMITGFDYKDLIMDTEPPIMADSFAQIILNLYTNEVVADNKLAWQDWWDKNKENIIWDEQQKKFIIQTNLK